MRNGPCRGEKNIPINIEGCPSISIIQDQSNSSATGWLVWPVALLFCKYLVSQKVALKGKRTIELGSGTGLLGIVLSSLGCATTVVSDLSSALALIQRNVLENGSLSVSVRELSWGDSTHISAVLAEFGPSFDLIIGTDIVYHQESFVLEALAQTVISLSSPSTVFMLAYEERDGMIEDEAHFFSKIRSHYSSVQLIDLDPTDTTRYLVLLVHMFDHLLPTIPHQETHFLSDPTANESVLFLPGGKVMLVDLGIQSFVKNVVSITIAGAVLAGVGVYGIIWADQRLNANRKVRVAKQAPTSPTSPLSEYDSE